MPVTLATTMACVGYEGSAEGDAQKSVADPIADAYKTILGSPDQALRAMTPQIANGLYELLKTYLGNLPQKQ